VAKTNPRDPNLRAATVARVNQLVKGGMTKAGAFEKISAETGRAKDAVQMLYYRAIRATGKPGPAKSSVAAAPKAVAAAPGRRRGRRPGSRNVQPAASQSGGGDFPKLLNGVASAINNLLKHFEKTVEENETLKAQAQRLDAITSLLRGR
jgi:hypothetical protein